MDHSPVELSDQENDEGRPQGRPSFVQMGSEPISRILSKTTIYLRPPLPAA